MRSGKEPSAVDRWNHAVRVAFEGYAPGDQAGVRPSPNDQANGPDDLMDEVLAMSDAEIEAELRAAGVDLDAFDAQSSALYEKYFGAAAAPEPSVSAAPPEPAPPIAAPEKSAAPPSDKMPSDKRPPRP